MNQGGSRVTRTWVHDKAGRLIDHNQGLVLIDNAELYGFIREHFRDGSDWMGQHSHGVLCQQTMRWLGQNNVIDKHLLILNQRNCFCSGAFS